MRKIYIAADGGGTKLELAAVAPGGEILCTVRQPGGVNPRTSDKETVKKVIEEAKNKLTEAVGGFDAQFCAGYFMHNTSLFSEIFGCEAVEVDEGTLGLYAAGIYGDGVLILSGTGADTYIIKDGKTLDIIGGYGPLLGDEGSGFSIGRDAINAAIADYEGTGEKTLLSQLLRKKYPSDTFRGSVYGVYQTPQAQKNIADFCYECEKAADTGDKAAINIFKTAAYALAAYAETGYNKFGLDKNTPYTFSGGVILHDIKRQTPLMLPHLTEYLTMRGIKNQIMPKTTPILAAAEWIKRNIIE